MIYFNSEAADEMGSTSVKRLSKRSVVFMSAQCLGFVLALVGLLQQRALQQTEQGLSHRYVA